MWQGVRVCSGEKFAPDFDNLSQQLARICVSTRRDFAENTSLMNTNLGHHFSIKNLNQIIQPKKKKKKSLVFARDRTEDLPRVRRAL